jgi:hypothetical protein
MKKYISIVLCAAVSLATRAQKVDLDKYNFKASVIELPRNYFPAEVRTYASRIAVSGNMQGFAMAAGDAVTIPGYTMSIENPSVKISGNLSGLRLVSSNVKTRVSESKDKNGKVTSSKTYYFVEARFTGTASYEILGPSNPYQTLKEEQKPVKKSKKETKKEESLASNPFLAGASAASTTAAGSGNGYATQRLAENVSRDYTYSTPEFSSYADASNAWTREAERQLFSTKQRFSTEFLGIIQSVLNREYGYRIDNSNYHLWILDNKNHPEYELQQKVIEAIKVLMPRLNGAADLKQMSSDIKPIMDYFTALPAKYPGTEKADKKMRYSAYYNLAKLSYLFDDYAAAQLNGELLIKNDFDTKDGEEFIEMAQELKHQLDFFHIDSRQFAAN